MSTPAKIRRMSGPIFSEILGAKNASCRMDSELDAGAIQTMRRGRLTKKFHNQLVAEPSAMHFGRTRSGNDSPR